MKVIACINHDTGIGKDGKLLVHLKEDMKFFKMITENNPVIYGNNTLKSFPNQKPLKNRINFVLTKDPTLSTLPEGFKDWNIPVCEVFVNSKMNQTGLYKEGVKINISSLNNSYPSDFSTKLYIVHDIISLINALLFMGYYKDAYVCGGATIYKQLLDYCDEMYLTEIDYDIEADTFFPKFNKNEWEANNLSGYRYDKDAKIYYRFMHYIYKDKKEKYNE